MTEATTGLLRPGETCWRAVRAGRLAFLVDGEETFAAIADAIENARRRVWLLGWDFHTAVRLRRDGPSDAPDDLVGLLEAQVRRHDSLQVHVLAWDFALLYALERQPLPLLQFGARTHRRIHFAMDASHPATASQHQKLVVVDDAVAFAGGFDLTSHRWDTRRHRARDPRRVAPSGKAYPPFHDVQMVVDGEAAASLGHLARERWRHATGERVDETRDAGDAWPASVRPHARDVTVGISRTVASIGDAPEVREVEALYRESIAAARRWIYIENQYLTSGHVGDWLARRLAEPEGPEVVVVGPRENSGWLEEHTMGALRDRLVRKLRAADRHGRFRMLYPHLASLAADEFLNVHSKVMVVDDDFARVGSSNLSNRSLGLDTECDLSFESEGRETVRRAIARFRNDLLAEHLGASEARVADELANTGSLLRTLDALSQGERSLRPLELDASAPAAEAVEALAAFDPEHPAPLEDLVTHFEEAGALPPRNRARTLAAAAALALSAGAGLVALYATSLADRLTMERVAAAWALLPPDGPGLLLATAAFTLACLLLVPVMALAFAAGLALGPGLGIPVAWAGTVAAAALGHAAGGRLWRESVRHLAGDRLPQISRRLARHGILASALARILPVAPFMVVNLVAGASRVRARDFVVGTALGVLPGTLVLVIAADRIGRLADAPGEPAWPWMALAGPALAGWLATLRRLPRLRAPDTSGA